MSDYEGVRRVTYGDDDRAVFVPVCETCGRFVRPDESVATRGERLSDEPNATCSRCGRTRMLFEGFM